MVKQSLYRKSSTRGFSSVSGLVQSRISKASEGRGFAVTRLLTHWNEVVGPDIANIAAPAQVSYGRGGLGATLTVLTTGAQAPILDMQKERIREKVNACYGYNAISKVKITQTSPQGFHEGKARFHAAPKVTKTIDPKIETQSAQMTHDVTSSELQDALRDLGMNVLAKNAAR